MSAPEVMSPDTLEIKRSKRLKGTASLLGDPRQAFQALLMAALAEGPTKIENLPDTPWFKEALQVFIRLGYAQQALDGHWLIHGGSRPLAGAEGAGSEGPGPEAGAAPLRVRHEADLLALAGFLSGQGVRRVIEVDLDGVSGDVLALLGKILKIETLAAAVAPGAPVAVADRAEVLIGESPAEARERAAGSEALGAAADEAAGTETAPGESGPEDLAEAAAAAEEAVPEEEPDEEFELGPLAEEADVSPSMEALRAISDPPKPKKVRKPKPDAAAPAAEADAGGPEPEEEGRFLRLIPGELTVKAQSLVAGTLPGRPGQGPARLVDIGWDEYLSKVALLAWHLGAGKALDLSFLKGGPELVETVAVQFGAPLKADRNNADEGDELARRIARQMRAAGKQEPTLRLRLSAPVKLKPQSYTVPADVTETAALCLAATLLKGSDLTLEGVVLNPSRAGFLAALRRMGADIEVVSRRERQGETLGTLRVRSADLLGKRFGADNLATMRDEVFLLMVAAAYAEGETIIRDVSHLRHLRRDLLKSFAAALKSAGVEIGEIEDGLVVRGRPDYDGTAYDALGHPPLALAGLVMALKSHGASALAGGSCLESCYPGLLDQLAALAAPDKGEKGKAGKGGKDEGAAGSEDEADDGEAEDEEA